MKKYLGFTDAEVEENFKMLAKEKQLVAIADWLADKISDDNPPVGYQSPIKLKSDLDAEEKINGATKPESKDDKEVSSADSSDASASDEPPTSEEPPGGEGEEKEANPEEEPPSFGLN